MEKLSCILVDDELHARRLLRAYVDRSGAFEVLAECANAEDARAAVEQLRPRVLFLDVQLPGKSGIELAATLGEPAPLVVFTTAYDQYAIRAFDASAVDYLLKPFDEERFAQAVTRVQRMHAGTVAAPSLAALLPPPAPAWPERLTCRTGARLRVIEVADILCIEAAGNYSKAMTRGGVQLLGAPISEMEKKLDPTVFLRVHRSTIVNTRAIASITTHLNGEYKLTLHDGTVAKVSRSYKTRFNEVMGRL